jgi:hypothetical protein
MCAKAEEGKKSLSESEKQAIRSYILKFMTPSAVILSIVSAILGYVASGLTRLEVFADAHGKASQEIFRAVADAASAKSEAQLLLNTARTASSDYSTAVNGLKAALSDADKFLSGNYQIIAEKLVGVKVFRDSLANVADERINALQAQLNAIQGKLVAVNKTTQQAGRFGGGTAPILCPTGQVVVGVQLGSEILALQCGQLAP